MTTWLARLGLTRDSALLVWGKLVGLAGVIVAGGFDPKTLGLSERQAKAVTVAAGLIVYASAQYSHSGLPSKHDAQTVDVARLR